ncbi:MAG: hypothetical protein ACREBF_04680 [Candidatus Micrarchaeales archaeon]
MNGAVTTTEIKRVLVELDSMELQILRLKSILLPKVKATKKELLAIEEAERDIKRGLGMKGEDFIKELTKA